MNTLLDLSTDEPQWFHGLWTFLFGAFYINYKINKFNDDLVGNSGVLTDEAAQKIASQEGS